MLITDSTELQLVPESREITNRLAIKYSKSSFQFRNNAFPIKLSTNSIRMYIYMYTQLQYTIVDSIYLVPDK